MQSWYEYNCSTELSCFLVTVGFFLLPLCRREQGSGKYRFPCTVGSILPVTMQILFCCHFVDQHVNSISSAKFSSHQYKFLWHRCFIQHTIPALLRPFSLNTQILSIAAIFFDQHVNPYPISSIFFYLKLIHNGLSWRFNVHNKLGGMLAWHICGLPFKQLF
jgi:hypothetical protein